MKIFNGTQVYLTNTLNNLTLAVNENGTLIQEDLQLEDGVLAEHQGGIILLNDFNWDQYFFKLEIQ